MTQGSLLHPPWSSQQQPPSPGIYELTQPANSRLAKYTDLILFNNSTASLHLPLCTRDLVVCAVLPVLQYLSEVSKVLFSKSYLQLRKVL